MLEMISQIQGSMLLCSTKTLLTGALLFGYSEINAARAAQFGMHGEDFTEALSEIRPSFNERSKHHHLVTSFVEAVDSNTRTVIMKTGLETEDQDGEE